MRIEKVGLAKGNKVILRACSQAGCPRPQWLGVGGGGCFGGRGRGTRRSRGSRGWDEGVRAVARYGSTIGINDITFDEQRAMVKREA